MEKLNFFEYCAEQEAMEGENVEDWVEHFKKYYTKGVWESYRTGEPRHDGDCTKCPYTCDLCVLGDMLAEYKKYYFDKE